MLEFGYADQLRVLLGNPRLGVRLAGRAGLALDPWIAENIGQVEDQVLGRIPDSMWSIGQILHRWPGVQLVVLAAPWFGLLVLLVRRRRASSALALEATALICVAMLVTLGVTVMGDGLADTAKQGHLVVNAALAWVIAVGVLAARRAVSRPQG